MRYYGESNVPGAPGIQFAGGNFMGGEGSAINPEAFKRDARQQKIYNKGINTDNPNEKEIFLRRTGPQLPLAGNVFGAGNMAGMQLAQAQPEPGGLFVPPEGAPSFIPPMGNMPSGPSPQEMEAAEKERMRKMREAQILQTRTQERSNVIDRPVVQDRPLLFEADASPQGVDRIFGGLNMRLDPSQNLRIGGTVLPGYTEENVPIPTQYGAEAVYETPGTRIKINYRDRRPGASIPGGFGGQVDFNTRF